ITNIEEDLENNENELKIKKDNLDALNEIMADLRQKFKDLEKTKLIQEAIEKLDEDLSI
ncbi:MAG: hypothetical protein GTO02_14895, partial [Candidatus Dadabacteria bacterium]|nr:hypothetical protein [Candidatus Dadabacteria bacterium]